MLSISTLTTVNLPNRQGSSFIANIAKSKSLHILALVLVTWTCFGRTLGSYFLADDFSEVNYVSQIFHGSPELFWSNFIGPYLQNPSIHVYRPWMHMTQVIDYLIWHVNAFGFYLSNLVYYTGDVILLYLVIKELTCNWSAHRSHLAAFFAALLFATNPLHCESVSWMVGRVDGDCCFYYLLSIFLLTKALHQNHKIYRYAAVTSFWLAMFTKEMAVLLPVLIASIGFLWPNERVTSIGRRIMLSWQISKPFWLSLAIYFCLRFLFLGTLLGGYTGGIGAAQTTGVLTRWLDFDTVRRIFYPLTYSIFHGTSLHSSILTFCYAALVTLAVVRILAQELSWKWCAFLAIWVITTILPIYRLWGLGYNLEGARFYFFLSLPLSVLWAIVVFHPAPSHVNAQLGPRLSKSFLFFGSIVLLVMASVFGRAAYATNLLWVHAGKEVKSFSRSCEMLAQTTPKDKLIILLGIPKDHGGAHLILNATTFNTMLSPPFVKESISDRFVVFDPVYFGPPEYIDRSRFKRWLSSPQALGPFVWNSAQKKFDLVDLKSSSNVAITNLQFNVIPSAIQWQPHTLGHAAYATKDGAIEVQNSQEGDGLRIANLHINPLDVDFLEFQIKRPVNLGISQLKVHWNCSNSSTGEPVAAGHAFLDLPPIKKSRLDSNGFEHVLIPLSHFWRWYANRNIADLELVFPPSKLLILKNIHLTAAADVMPMLTVADGKESNAGVYDISDEGTNLFVNLPRNINAHSVEIEISKPDYFLDNFAVGSTTNPIAQTKQQPITARSIHLNFGSFKQPGFYQVRAHCINSAGQPVGEYSDPITLHVR